MLSQASRQHADVDEEHARAHLIHYLMRVDSNETLAWVAHASRVLVSASRRNGLFCRLRLWRKQV